MPDLTLYSGSLSGKTLVSHIVLGVAYACMDAPYDEIGEAIE